ncbi:MAG: NAD-dependent epimerase/dehydratase family protein [Candidatus Woykebacteria bacterium]
MSTSAQDRIFPFKFTNSQTKTALVAGGAGIVGSNICESLLSLGFSVICIDNLTSGEKSNVESLVNSPNFSFVKADINSPSFILPEEVKVDVIFHAAGLEEFSINKNLSLETLLVNSLGTRVLLEIAKVKKAKFIFVSTAELYSGAFSSTSLKYYFGKNPQDESTFTHNEAKRFAEALVFEYFKQYNLDALIVRIKDVYGPKMNLQAEGVVNKLIKETIEERKLTIAGDGLKTINPTFISDVTRGIIKATQEGSSGEIYNLVSPEKITVANFAQTLNQVVGGLQIFYKKGLEDMEIPYHQLDLSTTIEKLGWRPIVNLADGVYETLNYFTKKAAPEQKKAPIPIFSPAEAVSKKAEKPRIASSLHRHLRLIIFISSLALILITVVYPGSALLINTFQGNSNFEKSIDGLEADDIASSKTQAEKSEKYYQKASQNLNNLKWLLQIFIEREKLSALSDFYFGGEKISASEVSAAQALTTLSQEGSKEEIISEADLNKFLLDIKALAQEAEIKLEMGSTKLDSIETSKLPNSLLDDASKFREGKSILEDIIKQLLNSTNT